VCIVDSKTRHIFAGDSFGLSYRDFDVGARQFVFPSCAPVQFDPVAFHQTLDLLTSLEPPAIYVTHYSQVRDVPRLAADMHRLVDAFAALGQRCAGKGSARLECLEAGMKQLVVDEASAQGWNGTPERALKLLGTDIRLNAQGLESWLESRAKSGA
jgi:hydroxyacylglutathione hydrolase